MSIIKDIPEIESFTPVEKIGGLEFELGPQIGAGGRAKVYKGQELCETDRTIAVKLITYLVSETPTETEKKNVTQLIEDFGMEANIWARFQQSPHVVALYRVFKQRVPMGDGLLLVFGYLMELATDGDVFSYLRKRADKPFFEKHEQVDEARFLRDIARGIEVGHDRDLIHGDIKASNVLLFNQHGKLRPKVMDFGISQSTTHHRQDNSGTPEYMAPEQFLAQPKTTQKSDVYALGILFYRILTGKIPDAGNEQSKRDVRLNHCSRPDRAAKILKEVENIKDKAYRELVARMVEKEPEKRISLGTVLRLLEVIVNTRIAVKETTNDNSMVPHSNQHRWHPRVHYALGEKLCYYFITGHLPLVDPVIIKNYLFEKGIRGFAIYRVLGGVDYVLRVWADSVDQEKVEGVLKQFQAMNRGNYRAFIGTNTSHFCSVPIEPHLEQEMEDDPNERALCLAQLYDYLRALESQPESDHSKKSENIVIAKLLQGGSEKSDEFPVRVFLTVQTAGEPSPVQIRQVSVEFAYHFSRLEKRVGAIRDLSVYGGKGDVQMILKFRIRQFADFALVFKQFLDVAALVQTDSFTVSPQTYVEITGLDKAIGQDRLPESDDGGIGKFYADRKDATDANAD